MGHSIFLTRRKRTRFTYRLNGLIQKSEIFITNKRQRFVISVLTLSAGLFFSENLLSKSGFFVVILLAVFTDLLFFFCLRRDIKGNNIKYYLYAFILPFFYTLSFGLFYFLAPARFLTRIFITALYAVGLYSLFLAQNIFLVASVRTIGLISGARIVSFLLTIIAFFFFSDVVFSFDLSIVLTAFIIFLSAFCLILQSIWTVELDSSLSNKINWTVILSVCLFEFSLVLGFWPANSTIIAIFLTGFLYIVIGLSQAWLDKRLFKGIIWEYIWVGAIVFSLLMFSTFV